MYEDDKLPDLTPVNEEPTTLRQNYVDISDNE